MNELPSRAVPKWSAAMDSRMRRMRIEGLSWTAVAAALCVTRDAATSRGRRIGLQQTFPAEATAVVTPDLGREPLPAGDPIAWAVLVEGTSLEGTPYPYPPLPSGGC